jgi:hypothetical protein
MMEMSVAGADSQVQVDAVFENMANVIRQAASASIGTKISGRSTAAWWTRVRHHATAVPRSVRCSRSIQVCIRLGPLPAAEKAKTSK